MGCAPKRAPKPKKAPSLKVVATVVLAGVKMQNMAREWSEQKKLKASLVKGLENLRSERKEKGGRQGLGGKGKAGRGGVR